ncbi:hypothetical protein Cpin_3462 [Chitinophaga pinensis DSM 2588]|uniref:Uncharacterized protein n=1 Tax=Chitinophaga pinensis (strain ATCC 43595 / DSM 2588 / LMG 13176 / NBRC 15968 / NCIMB 11800 / UQM 2034) TaxID=485918 RepID=A0A979G4X4_CHIPD|nr:hypothetical protein Cpin_3462 [Chitinophaga pinensis DSM 2588]
MEWLSPSETTYLIDFQIFATVAAFRHFFSVIGTRTRTDR